MFQLESCGLKSTCIHIYMSMYAWDFHLSPGCLPSWSLWLTKSQNIYHYRLHVLPYHQRCKFFGYDYITYSDLQTSICICQNISRSVRLEHIVLIYACSWGDTFLYNNMLLVKVLLWRSHSLISAIMLWALVSSLQQPLKDILPELSCIYCHHFLINFDQLPCLLPACMLC